MKSNAMEKDKDKKLKDKGKDKKDKEAEKSKQNDKKSKDKEKAHDAPTVASTTKSAPKKYTIVIFDGNSMHRWDELFASKTLADGSTLRIVQCSWMDAEVCVYGGQSGS
jgi:hypothetical protein